MSRFIVLFFFICAANSSYAVNTKIRRKPLQAFRCAEVTCKKNFSAALSALSKQRVNWINDVNFALKQSGTPACLAEVKEISQSNSVGVAGCADCTYAEMKPLLKSEMSYISKTDAVDDEKDEANERKEVEKTSDLIFSNNENIQSVFGKIRSDFIDDLKDKCNSVPKGHAVTIKKINTAPNAATKAQKAR